MDQIKEFFFNWQVLLVSVSSFIILGVVRSMGTRKDENGKVIGGFTQSKWFKAFTPLYPYLLCLGLVFLVPLPKIVVDLGKKAVLVKLLFGLYAGWLSAYSFQVIKKILENVAGMKFDPEPAEAKPADVKPADPPAAATGGK